MDWLVDIAHRAQVAEVHAELAELLRTSGADAAAIDEAGIVFGELISNVVRHASGPAAVSLEWTSGGPVLTVEDTGRGFELVADPAVDPLAEHGRGLLIVAALADDLRVDTSRHGGARVRVRLFSAPGR